MSIVRRRCPTTDVVQIVSFFDCQTSTVFWGETLDVASHPTPLLSVVNYKDENLQLATFTERDGSSMGLLGEPRCRLLIVIAVTIYRL